MSLEKLKKITEEMDPETALASLAGLVKDLFPLSGRRPN